MKILLILLVVAKGKQGYTRNFQALQKFDTTRADPEMNCHSMLAEHQLSPEGLPYPSILEVISVTVILNIEIAQKLFKTNDAQHHKLISDLQVLSKNESSSDITFVVGKNVFKAHKVILMARSAVLATMFSCDMLEKKTNKVEIKDIGPEIFEEVLGFIYCGQLSSLDLEFEKMVAVLKTADIYGMMTSS